VSATNIPQQLQDFPNWVTWKYETRDGKETKVPFDAKNGKFAKSNDASTWATFDDAAKAAEDVFSDHNYDGIGFMLHGTPLTGLDFDGVVKDGIVEPFVLDILAKLGDPYTEITPSGNGLRAFVTCGALPAGKRKFTDSTKGKYGAEIYNGSEGGRYLTITGNKFSGNGNGIPQVENISLAYFMISQIHNERLKALWMGDLSEYQDDQSRADLALLGILARLFDNDARKMEWVFGASKLGRRDKWITRKDYREMSIAKAGGIVAKAALVPAKVTGTQPTVESTLDTVCLADVSEKIQRWLWMNRIPLDALTNFSGEADKGKTLVLEDTFARLTTGRDFADGAPNPFGGVPKKVIIVGSEDAIDTATKPRMRVMGADMSKVLVVTSVSVKGEKSKLKRQFYLEQDLKLLREKLQSDPEIIAVGFDPITNYLGDRCDMLKSQDVRRALTPLCDLAKDSHVTIISILHFNKSTKMSAMSRATGSSALVEVPRASWCFTNDDDPANKGGFLMLRVKGNLGKRVGGLSYRIEETFIDIGGEQASEPQLIWGTVVEKTADDVLAQAQDTELKGIAKARGWLEEYFPNGLARRSTDVYDAALAVGITADCVKKARASLKMQSKKINWVWWMRRGQDNGKWVFRPEPTEDGNEPDLDPRQE
jgi:hypothetical protein